MPCSTSIPLWVAIATLLFGWAGRAAPPPPQESAPDRSNRFLRLDREPYFTRIETPEVRLDDRIARLRRTLRHRHRPAPPWILSGYQRHHGNLRVCHRRAHRNDPAAEGLLKLRVTIGKRGRVTRTRVLSDTTDLASLSQCLVDRIGRWQFRPPEAKITRIELVVFHAAARGKPRR